MPDSPYDWNDYLRLAKVLIKSIGNQTGYRNAVSRAYYAAYWCARKLVKSLGGSTSVPGLDAKPIVDVQVSVASFDPLDLYRTPIEGLGFVYRDDNPDLTKRYFREAPGERRTHIHVCLAGSWREQFMLLFRDYLRAHSEDAKRYAQLKYRLADEYGEDRQGYTEAKGPFIWEVMEKADRWNQAIGWQPGPSDA